jgi:hypothetical protein
MKKDKMKGQKAEKGRKRTGRQKKDRHNGWALEQKKDRHNGWALCLTTGFWGK